MDLFLASLTVAVVTALFRLVPGTLWSAPGSDAGYHLLLRREIRRNQMRMPYRIKALALDEQQTYPWFYHWLLAFIPQQWLEKISALPSAIIDTLYALLAFGLAAKLAPLAHPGLEPATTGLLAGLLFGTSPALLAVGVGPRAYDITARPLGELLFSLSLVAAMFYLLNGSVWWAVVSVLSSAFLLLSSKFAAQVLVFCVPIIAFITTQWRLLLLLPAALLVALLLSRGRYWLLLKGQIVHLQLYRTRMQYDHPAVIGRNNWSKLWQASKAVMASAFRDTGAIKELQSLIDKNTYLLFASRNMLWIGCVSLALLGVFPAWAEAGQSWEEWLWALSVSPIFPFFLTSLKGWRFLGEAERYPEYGVLPVSVLASIGWWSVSRHLAIGLLLVYSGLTFFVLAYQLLRRRRAMNRSHANKINQLVDYLDQIPKDSNILCVPLTLIPFAIAYRLEVRFLSAMDHFVWSRDYDRIYHKYPWTSIDLQWWRETHGAEFVVVQNNYLSPKAGCQWEYDFTNFTLVFDNDFYQVYQVNSSQLSVQPTISVGK